MGKEKIGVLGCGWYGLALAKALLAEGYPVHGTTTHAQKLKVLEEAGISPFLVNLNHPSILPADFFTIDILVCCFPPRPARHFIAAIQNLMLKLEQSAVKQLLFISSISVFGNRNQIETETDLPEPDTENGQLLLEAEIRLQTLKHTQVTILRFGGLTGPGRDLSQHFAGRKNIPNGLAPVNLIHLDDCIGITRAIIQKKAFGKIYHGVAPQHPGRAVYYQNLCEQNRQELPVFIMERTAWKQINSIHIPLILNYRWQKNIL